MGLRETERIGVVGLGYVGSPLALAFANAGFHVVGYDVDPDTIETLRTKHAATAGSSPGTDDHHTPKYTTDPNQLRDCDVVITAVPTPVTEDSNPDLSYVRAAARTIGEQLTPQTTVVLESTVYPGVTRQVFAPEIERVSGLSLGDDFAVGYSPERLTPGSDHNLRNSVKPVSGNTDAVRSELLELYDAIVDEAYPAPTIESAEAAKCLENVQRDLNIALINEFAIACNEFETLDYEDVLSVADTKWNFQRYSPGLVGGHCIPVDPHFLIYRLEQHGASASLMREARSVNESVVDYILELTEDAVSERDARIGTDVSTDRLLACGLSYKPNASDVRSKAKRRLFDGLRHRGFDVVGYDPHVDPDVAADAFDLEMQSSIRDGAAAGILMLTNHDEFSSITFDEIIAAFPAQPIVVDASRAFDEPNRSDVVYRQF